MLPRQVEAHLGAQSLVVRMVVRVVVLMVAVAAGDVEVVPSAGRGRGSPRVRELWWRGGRGVGGIKVQLPVAGVGV